MTEQKLELLSADDRRWLVHAIVSRGEEWCDSRRGGLAAEVGNKVATRERRLFWEHCVPSLLGGAIARANGERRILLALAAYSVLDLTAEPNRRRVDPLHSDEPRPPAHTRFIGGTVLDFAASGLSPSPGTGSASPEGTCRSTVPAEERRPKALTTTSVSEDPYGVSEIAERLSLSASFVRDMCAKGVIRADSTPGGHYRIPPSSLRELGLTL